MSEGQSLISIPDISKPATVLIEKVSEAIGGIARPYQMVRMAKAEAEAGKIKALADIEITEIQERGIRRLIAEEGRNQKSIEDVTTQSIPFVREDAQPEKIDQDWLANFFDKAKLISDAEMQSLWAKILAGEANNPGSFSKRTIALIANLEKWEAELFTRLCCCSWMIEGKAVPLVYDYRSEVYTGNDITFGMLSHLNDIGLVSLEALTGIAKHNIPKSLTVSYYGSIITLQFPQNEVVS